MRFDGNGHEEGRATGNGARMIAKQDRIAARIHGAMQPFLRGDKDEVAILTGMSDYMADFKTLIDTAKPGVMDELWRRHSFLDLCACSASPLRVEAMMTTDAPQPETAATSPMPPPLVPSSALEMSPLAPLFRRMVLVRCALAHSAYRRRKEQLTRGESWKC
jgi:hypothetical protein